MTKCCSPNCDEPSVDIHKDTRWCGKHYGIYPHQCEYLGCGRIVQYDDEPWCFTHSPDSGSSVRGYSAYDKVFRSTL